MTKKEAITKINEAEASEAIDFKSFILGKKFLVASHNQEIERERLIESCEKFAKKIETLEKLKEATKTLPEDMSILFEAIAAQASSSFSCWEKLHDD